MNKVGIITWHYSENYGSALQTYALKRSIEKIGKKVRIINYRAGARTSLLFKLLRFIRYNIIYPSNSFGNRKKRFEKFRNKNFNETPMYSQNKELKKNTRNFDVFVCGSDQIWSPNRFDSAYFLDFVPNHKRRISYAPSVVIDSFNEEQKKIVKEEISKFDFVSVRESYGAKIIENITGIKPLDVLDPTLLLDKAEYKKIISKPNIKEKYILCYLIGDNPIHRKMIEKYSKLTGYKIVALPFRKRDFNFGDYQLKGAGPKQFLGLIEGAEIVCTDSFHGILFSITFRKDFYAIKRFSESDPINQNERVINILKKFKLEERYVSDLNDVDIKEKIDYSNIEKIIKKDRKRSLEFLKKSLN